MQELFRLTSKIYRPTFDFEEFEHLQKKIVKDIVTGIDYLHSNYVVHQGPKPASILV